MKKRIALALCLVMMLSCLLCGCGSEKDKLIGSWTGSIDMAEAINTGIEEGLGADAADMAEYMTIDSLKITMTITFNKDNTYSIVVDETALDQAMKDMMDEVVDGLARYFEDMMAAEGLDMTVEELLALSGMSLDTLAEEMYAAVASEDMFDDLNSEGNFKVSDGKLFLSAGLEYAVDEAFYDLYTVEGSTLTINKGTNVSEYDEYTYPMVFTKN